MKEKREAEIVREVLLGDVQAFGSLVREYQRPVYNLMLRMVKDADIADDLAQEAFARAYEKLETFNQGKRFFPWLYSVSLNIARDWLRKKGRDIHVFTEEAEVFVRREDAASPQSEADIRLDAEKAYEAVSALAPKYREALILRYRHDCTMQEIADTLEISVSGAKMRIRRGLDKVRQQFGGEAK